ncbi:cortical protein marker for cell polarity-domain-containing protein, partial [Endogone sp. FLAS-F59071]
EREKTKREKSYSHTHTPSFPFSSHLSLLLPPFPSSPTFSFLYLPPSLAPLASQTCLSLVPVPVPPPTGQYSFPLPSPSRSLATRRCRHSPPLPSCRHRISTMARLLSLLPFFLAVGPTLATYMQIPSVNFTSFQQLGIAGQYGGISFYNDNLQTASLDFSRSSLLLQTNGSFELVATTNPNGVIHAVCSLPRSSDPTGSTVDIYIAGNFTSINSFPAANIAHYDPQTHQISALLTGLDGTVLTLYCDQTSDSVYAGGSFQGPVVDPPQFFNSLTTFGGSVAVWKNGNWSGMPWKGFNGPVNTITYNPQQHTILFGGAFDGTTDGAFQYAPTSQPVNLNTRAYLAGGNSATTSGLDDPASVICSSATDTDLTAGTNGSQWLLEDDIPGWWQINLQNPIIPALFRLRNSAFEGRGTQSFGILALPDDSFYNLSYIDPLTNTIQYCTTDCTLSNDTSIQYQDFMVAQPVSAQGIRIEINSWYGAGGGLASVQIFQTEVQVYAESDLNFPNCSGTPFQPSSNTTGTWQSTTLEGSYRPILVDTFLATDLATSMDGITFTPYLPEQGLYEVYMITPGCPEVSQCDERILVDILLNLAPNETFTVQLDQNTPTDRYDLLWNGYVAATQPGVFVPSVTLRPAHNATTTSTNVQLVADSVQFLKNSTTQSLSGVLEFSEANYTQNPSGGVSWRALSEQLPFNAVVNTIDASSGDLYIGGRFTGSIDYNNIVKYTYTPTPKLVPLPSGGVNGNVSIITLINGDLFVGGSFQSTIAGSSAFNNIARFNLQDNSWHALESGVNGPVLTITPLTGTTAQTAHPQVHISGNFTQLISASADGASEISTGYAVWNMLTNTWQKSPPGLPFIDGTASAIMPYINSTNATHIVQSTYFAGKLSGAQNLQAFGLSSLDSGIVNDTSITPGLSPYPFFDPESLFATPANTTPFTVNAGAFWTDSRNGNASVTIVGGEFVITEGVRDLALYENGTWTGLTGASWSGRVDSLAVYNDLLYIGGVFNLTVPNTSQNSHSLVVYDLVNKTYAALPDLFTSSGAPAQVNVIENRPDTTSIIVAGAFDKAGSLPCPGVCLLDTSSYQWSALGLGVQGTVMDLEFVGSSLYIAGDLEVNNVSAHVAQYDFNAQTWSTLGPATGTDAVPGPATAITYDISTGKTFVAGTSVNGTYLSQYDGSKYILLTQELGPSSTITQLFVVPATALNATDYNSNIVEKGAMLMVVGLLDIYGVGNVSAALFDGVSWYPYLVATGADGGPGVINSIFFKNCCPNAGGQYFLPIPIVILISIAIALGLVFLIVLVALLILFIKRKREAQQNPQPRPEAYYGKPPRRPQSLLALLGPGADTILNHPEKSANVRSDSRGSTQPRPDSGLAHEMVEASLATGALSGVGGAAAVAAYRNNSHDRLVAESARSDSDISAQRPDSEAFTSIYNADRPESQDYYSSFAPSRPYSEARMDGEDYSAIRYGAPTTMRSRPETAADFATYYSEEDSATDAQRDSTASEFGSLSAAGALTGFAAIAAAAASNDKNVPASEEHPHLYYAKYQFKAREAGELGFEVGDKIVVVDTSDAIWWMGSKDNGEGEAKQGVFPSNYVGKTPPSPTPGFVSSS